MNDDLLNFEIEPKRSSIIKVIGVGGGGSNAVNYMYEQGIKDVDFVVCNTDAQALLKSPVPVKLQLGTTLTEGLGAGNKPDQGKQAAIENLEDIQQILEDNTKMVFITAGMGGGTGTGAAPIIAESAKEKGILTVGIVTIPFQFEGKKRIKQAIEGIRELKENVDALLVINNEKLRDLYGDLEIDNAFAKADNILTVAAKGIAEIITIHGHVNVDFADVKAVMTDSGVAIMGTGIAEGEDRAINAVKQALESPLLNSNNIKGAKNVLLNIVSGEKGATMNEVGEISDFVQEEAGMSADLITGISKDPNLGDKIAVTVIATGFNANIIPELKEEQQVVRNVVELNDDDTIVSNNTTIVHETINYTPQKQPIQTTLDFKSNNPQGKMPDLSNPASAETIDKLESEPAYLRKRQNQQNENPEESESNEVSRFSISDDDDKIIKEDNSFLHGNVD